MMKIYLPEDSIKVLFYNTKTEHHEFEDNKYYYYLDKENDEDIFYGKITDNIYRILMRDINNKQVSVYINIFKYQHSLD